MPKNKPCKQIQLQMVWQCSFRLAGVPNFPVPASCAYGTGFSLITLHPLGDKIFKILIRLERHPFLGKPIA